jgi:hypothetical protein
MRGEGSSACGGTCREARPELRRRARGPVFTEGGSGNQGRLNGTHRHHVPVTVTNRDSAPKIPRKG